VSRVKLKHSIESLIEAGDPAGAFAVFAVVGGAPELVFEILKLAAAKNDAKTAGQCFDRLETTDYAGDWVEVAKALSTSGAHDRVLKAIARTEEGDRFGVLELRARSEAATGHPDRFASYQMLVDLYPYVPRAWRVRARFMKAEGDEAGELESWIGALKLNLKDREMLHRIARLRSVLNDARGSASVYLQLLRSDPTDVVAARGALHQLMRKKRWDEARELVDAQPEGIRKDVEFAAMADNIMENA
jgi:tetratricopeptide (TPR) repeat protein